ncbi:Lacal_2735 family protein [Tenacibaculum sp. 190524A02b]|uniref:Lacal_2735 family protein n=1 Tax=Tenacibaculum vairaonense TaxID=3137860 RepID=UPI0032B11ED6
MLRVNQLHRYKKHLEERYGKLVERANDYKYVDECKSDRSAFKAMKVLEKLNRLKYLDNEISNSII